MSFCTYIASDVPLEDDPILWRLSRGGEDIYTEKPFVAKVDPGVENWTALLTYLHSQMEKTEELEVWHIWQGIEYDPVVRSKEIDIKDLTVKDLIDLTSSDVFATTTQYDIPIQYRIVVTK